MRITSLITGAGILLLLQACSGEQAQAPKKNIPPVQEATARALSRAADTVMDLASLDTLTPDSPARTDPAPPLPSPRAVVKNPVYDFDFIDEGDEINHTFTIRNEGDATLRVRDVQSSCGCTVAEISSREIEPGDKTTVKAVFDSNNKFGRQRKTITLLTNGGQVELALTGVVRPRGFNPQPVAPSPDSTATDSAGD